MMNKVAWLFALLALAGCTTSATPIEKDEGGSGPRPSSNIITGKVVAGLIRASSCDDLLERIHDDVAAKIELQAEALKQVPDYGRGGPIGQGGLSGGFDNGGIPPGMPVGGTGGAAGTFASSGGSAAPTPGDGAAGTGGAGNPNGEGPVNLGPGEYSETNTQVEGVDEADIVKTDGSHIYMVHGNELFVLNSWPASDASIQSRLPIEGSAIELFVAEGIAVVFSTLYDQGDLIEQPPADSFMGSFGYYYGAQFTKVTMIDAAADEPTVLRELLIEGSYLSSRRHGSTVRAVLQGGFRVPPVFYASIEYNDPWGRPYSDEEIERQVDAWRDRTIAGVRSTLISDWLPSEREIIDGALTPPARRCTDFYAPPPGLSSYGLSNIVSFDMLDTNSPLGGAIVLGAADEVYSNDETFVLSQRDYRWDQQFVEQERTVLHLFDLDEADTNYRASGFVPGHIVDQFSIDEREGVLRISTTTQSFQNVVPDVARQETDEWVDVASQRSTDNRVIALRASADEEEQSLVRVGISPPLGRDGETIYSTRFVGDRAYVVTFQRTDPLIALDVSTPEEIKVLGELHIPGFSDYMHPIDADHLLTIGQNASSTGQVLGLMLQIFDVSDPTDPRLQHTFPYEQSGWSEANTNHKAFTFFQPSGDVAYDGLLAFPFTSYSSTFLSTLEVFEVSLENGFSRRGSIDHTALVQSCYDQNGISPQFGFDGYTCGAPEVRRGLFAFGLEGADEGYVYSISYGGMLVHDLANLAEPIAEVPLPSPDYNEHRGSLGSGGDTGGGFGNDGAAGGIPTDPGVAGAAGTAGTGAGGGSAGTGAGGMTGGSGGT
jgi:hypothetical protein